MGPWPAGAGWRYCVPFGWAGLFRDLGAQRPVGRLPGGGPRFSRETGGKRARGERFSPLDSLLWFGGSCKGSSFFCLACGPVSYARNGPPTSWAGWEGWFLRREGSFPPPKPSPWGGGGPAKPGRMRGRSCTQPFLVESLSGSRQSPQRNFSPAPLGNPIAPSSVTFGDSFPPRGSLWVVQPYTKKRPKSGHEHGHRNSPATETTRHDRQNERVPTSRP